jgi:hypothetical protein
MPYIQGKGWVDWKGTWLFAYLRRQPGITFDVGVVFICWARSYDIKCNSTQPELKTWFDVILQANFWIRVGLNICRKVPN